jgi:hypothetical protein
MPMDALRMRAGGQRERLVGDVIKLPREGRIVGFGSAELPAEPAKIIILPVIRIERHAEPNRDEMEPRTRPPAHNGGRRRLRRR